MDMQFNAEYQKLEDEEETLDVTAEDDEFFDVNDPRNDLQMNNLLQSK
jgi:hypothetical protein